MGAMNSWKVKIAEVGKPGSTAPAAVADREADRLARLQGHPVDDDPGGAERATTR